MKKLIKRKDGSYSKRGLWDNIRANKGSGKEPTKEMLKQESKIKKEENMNSMYKKGGKAPKKKMMKDSFMEESKEINFDAPRKYEKGGPGKGLFEKIKDTQETLKKTPSSAGPREQENYRLILKEREKMKSAKEMYPIDRGIEKSVFFNSLEDADRANEVDDLMLKNARKFSPASKKTGGMVETGMDVVARGNRAEGKATMAGKKKMMGGKYKKGGFPDLNKDGKVTQADILKGRGVSMKKKGDMKYDLGGVMEGARTPAEMRDAFKDYITPTPEMTTGLSTKTSTVDTGQNKMMAKKGGAKSMKPGGGGRFAKMVSGLKKEGKSEDSAKAIAASVGRKKYGKSKFQEMAAAGKKKMMGGKKC